MRFSTRVGVVSLILIPLIVVGLAGQIRVGPRTELAAAVVAPGATPGVAPAPAHGGHGGHHGHGHTGHDSEHGIAEGKVALATIICAVIIVGISICFELVRDFIHYSVPALYQGVVHVLYGELTNMGLIGILVFLLTSDLDGEGAWLEHMSEHFLGDGELLKEQVEGIHMLIFFFMLLLIVFVVGSLLYVNMLALFWSRCEKKVIDGEMSTGQIGEDYVLLRQRFISTCDQVKDDFEFSEYRKTCICQELGDMVEIQPHDWIGAMILMIVIYSSMYLAGKWDFIVFIVFMYALAYSIWYTFSDLRRIDKLLKPSGTYEPESATAAGDGKSYGTFAEKVQADAEVPVVADVVADDYKGKNAPAYLQLPFPVQRTNWFLRKILGPVGDRHRSLFWPGARGPMIIRFTLRVRFLVTAVVTAILLSFYADELWHTHPVVCVLAWLPLFALYALLPLNVAMLADVTSIELMKHENVIRDIVRKQRAIQSIALLKSLASMRTMLISGQPVERRSKVVAKNKAEKAYCQTLLSMFNSFDTDGSGDIDRHEFSEIMGYLKPMATEEEIEILFLQMDADKSGEISFDEFVSVMLAQHQATGQKGAVELANELWDMLDQDGTGQVNIQQLIKALKATGAKWDMSGVVMLFQQLDSDQSGTVDQAEFMDFVKRHI